MTPRPNADSASASGFGAMFSSAYATIKVEPFGLSPTFPDGPGLEDGRRLLIMGSRSKP